MSCKTNISKICRTCMQNTTNLKSIWDPFEETIIARVVTVCSGVEIVKDNNLPDQICQQCLNELGNYVQFSKKTRESDRQLREMFKIKNEYEADNTGTVSEAMAGFLEIEMDSVIKEESNSDIQSDYKDELQDFDCPDIKKTSKNSMEVKNESEKESQSDFEDDLEDPDFVMEIKNPSKGGKKKVYNKQKPKVSPKSDEDVKKQDDMEHDSPSKPTAKKVGRKLKPKPPQEPDVMDELEQKTFDIVEIKHGQSICCSCFQDFCDFKALEQHVKTDHKNNISASSSKEFVCEICFRGYICQQAVKTHRERTQKMSSVFECRICKFRCVFPKTRRTHALAHNKPEKAKEALGIICCAKMCEESFPTDELLIQHALIAHQADKIQADISLWNKNRPFQCNICYLRFNSEMALKRHCNRKYLPKRHQCPSCGQCYYSKQQLVLHEGTHMTEKNVECQICSRLFFTQAKLQEHLRYHAAKPRFVCDLCGSIFKKQSALQNHALAHDGSLPFVCEVCNKAFSLKSRLVYHKRQHTGESFHCRYCSSKFVSLSGRNNHERRTHPNRKKPAKL